MEVQITDFVPQTIDATRWETLGPLYQALLDRPVETAEDFERWLALFVSQTPQLAGISAVQIKTWFDWTAFQRQLKAIGIFSRMYLRDGKRTHLGYILPLLQRIQTNAGNYPELRNLNEQLDGCIEAAKPILTPLTPES